MTYDQLVDTFKSLSGRYDMDSETILLYLNAGQKFLDDSSDFMGSPGRYIYNGTTGLSFLSLIAQAKVISSVELIADGNRFNVYQIPVSELQSLSEQLPAFKPPSLPTCFALANLRKVSGATLRSEDTTKLAIVETGTVADKLGLLFECPIDKDYTIDISGKFYSPSIVEGTDPDTYWAVQYPFTLINACLLYTSPSPRDA